MIEGNSAIIIFDAENYSKKPHPELFTFLTYIVNVCIVELHLMEKISMCVQIVRMCIVWIAGTR